MQKYNKYLERYLYNIPKCELHLHLRGMITKNVFEKLEKKYDKAYILERYRRESLERKYTIPCKYIFFLENKDDENNIEDLLDFSSFQEFIDVYRFTGMYINDIEDFKLLISSCHTYLEEQNIVYAEVTVSIFEYLRSGLNLEDIQIILSNNKFYKIGKINWIIDLGWSSKEEQAYLLLKKVFSNDPETFVGITLGGRESKAKVRGFQAVYNLAKDYKMGTSIHVGETKDSLAMREAILELKPHRIGHGIRAVDSKEILRYIIEKNIALEICITSNVKLKNVNDYFHHPIFQLLREGVNTVISTDDPGMLKTDLVKEYEKLYYLGVEVNTICKLIKQSFQASFLTKEEKKHYCNQVEQKIGKNG